MITFYALSFILALYASRRIDRTLFMRVLIFGIMIVFNLIISCFQYDPTTIFILACGYAFACATPIKRIVKLESVVV